MLRALSVGRYALTALAVPGPARVIAVFGRSAYVETPGGLACIGVTAIGNGPLNAIVETFPPALSVGDALALDCAAATLWRPQPAPRWDPPVVRAALAALRCAVHGRLPAEGFGCLLGEAANLPPAIAALKRWMADPGGEPDAAAGLIGLGPGLTPAGDDLIGGALCALRFTGQAALAARLAAWALPLAQAGTSRISRAHLECAAEGECGEAVNDAIVALLAGGAPDLGRIDAVGHTSGWDALAGAALALGATATPAAPH